MRGYGNQNNGLPKDVHILIPESVAMFDDLWQKRIKFTNGIKSVNQLTLRGRDYLELFQGYQCNHMCPYK